MKAKITPSTSSSSPQSAVQFCTQVSALQVTCQIVKVTALTKCASISSLTMVV